MMTLTGIAVYPLKSARGSARPAARVEPWGLAGDRRWVILDPDGNRVRAVACPALMGVTALPGPDDALILRAPGLADLRVRTPVTGEPVPTTMSRVGHVIAAGPSAHAWLSEALGRKVRLAWLEDPGRRTVAEEHGGRPGETLSLADAGPLLLVSAASMRQLDEWIAETAVERGEEPPEPLDIARFRGNVIVDGAAPFSEERFQRVRIGDVRFRISEACDRCAVTLTEPTTLERGKEPLRTLARFRRREGKTWFGVRMVPEGIGDIQVGDPVTAD